MSYKKAGKTMSNKRMTKSTTKKSNNSNPKSPVKTYSKATTSSPPNRHQYHSKKSTNHKLKKFTTSIGINSMPKMTCTLLIKCVDSAKKNLLKKLYNLEESESSPVKLNWLSSWNSLRPWTHILLAPCC